MKILKLSIKGLQNLKNTLDVDFVAQQRVDNDAREQMFMLCFSGRRAYYPGAKQ